MPNALNKSSVRQLGRYIGYILLVVGLILLSISFGMEGVKQIKTFLISLLIIVAGVVFIKYSVTGIYEGKWDKLSGMEKGTVCAHLGFLLELWRMKLPGAKKEIITGLAMKAVDTSIKDAKEIYRKCFDLDFMDKNKEEFRNMI